MQTAALHCKPFSQSQTLSVARSEHWTMMRLYQSGKRWTRCLMRGSAALRQDTRICSKYKTGGCGLRLSCVFALPCLSSSCCCMMLRIRTSDGYEIILIREKKWIRLQMLSFMPDTAQQGKTISRSPHGERGLKYFHFSFQNSPVASLPTRGAWIEIKRIRGRGE